MYMMNYGRHISRMSSDYKVRLQDVDSGKKKKGFRETSSGKEALRRNESDMYGNDSTDFADSELESEDGFSEENAGSGTTWTREVNELDYCDDYSAGEESV
ncbi:hypothetical protein OXX79_013708, partial [Metschnikowia pulcherrima]